MKLTYLSALLLLICTTSCKKETIEPSGCEDTFNWIYTYDTILPSDYLMTYPGSWWEYSNGVIDSCFTWEPVPIIDRTMIDGCAYIDVEMQILPATNYGHIFNESTLRESTDYSSTGFYRRIDTIIGSVTASGYLGGSGNYTYESISEFQTLEHLDSMVVNGQTYYDVLHSYIWNQLVYTHLGGGPVGTLDSYYAKNAGLIQEDREWQGGQFHRSLVNHYIAPH
ncbi:MAG: hypothetical protein ACI837_001985 [Crocinitomicaceae bacterium]|jgi:hypothetical protein